MHIAAGRLIVLLTVAGTLACRTDSSSTDSPTAPGATTATVTFVYRASTIPRADLPAALASCVSGVGHTHIHPSWRSFGRIDMTPIGSERWEISFSDVPVGVRQSIRVSDGNACDENPTGAAMRNVFANGIALSEIVPTPGSGTEPGLAFTVSADGRVVS
jgi:hypothetical protein